MSNEVSEKIKTSSWIKVGVIISMVGLFFPIRKCMNENISSPPIQKTDTLFANNTDTVFLELENSENHDNLLEANEKRRKELLASADLFVENMAAVEENGKWGYIDENGDVVIDLIYDHCYAFRYGLGMVKLDGKLGLIDKYGEVYLKPEYDDIIIGLSRLIKVKVNGKWGLFEGTKLVLPIQYDEIYFDNHLDFRVVLNGKWGFYQNNGNEIWAPEFSGALPPARHYCPAKKNKWGIISTNADIILDFEYDYVRSDDVYRVYAGKNGKEYRIIYDLELKETKIIEIIHTSQYKNMRGDVYPDSGDSIR